MAARTVGKLRTDASAYLWPNLIGSATLAVLASVGGQWASCCWKRNGRPGTAGAEIAEILVISKRMVARRGATILEKPRMRDQNDLTRCEIRSGLTDRSPGRVG
ncbi:MAG: hypothetical protein ACTHMY_24440 [Solirubrobacteraceae bacterium]